jgi:hypothetical protein
MPCYHLCSPKPRGKDLIGYARYPIAITGDPGTGLVSFRFSSGCSADVSKRSPASLHHPEALYKGQTAFLFRVHAFIEMDYNVGASHMSRDNI